MAKYSYHCSKCGHTVLTDDKDEVKLAKKVHRARTVTLENGLKMLMPKCIYVPVKGTNAKARPALAAIIERRMADEAQ